MILKVRSSRLEYWGVGNVVQNTYDKAKVIDFNRKLVLTVFEPLYKGNDYKTAVNNTYALTIEDLINQKRIKQLPISTLSGDYINSTNGDLAPTPEAFFGDDFTVYRENPHYAWLCVDNNLETIEHPLQKLLNENESIFKGNTTTLYISQKNKYAVAMYGSFGNNSLVILSWDGEPVVIPVELKGELYRFRHHFTMSPSGKWVFFQTEKSGNYVLPIHKELPSMHLSPIKLDYSDNYIGKITWMTNPEGLIIYTEHKFHYWDLSKVGMGE